MIHAQSPFPLVKAAKKIRQQLEKKQLYGTLQGMCGIASVALLRELQASKIPAVIKENNGHCFVLSQNFVVDVTACQFGFRRIVVWPVQQAVRLSKIWASQRTFQSAAKFQKHQKKHWVSSQWATE
jgi:hypothetical protein